MNKEYYDGDDNDNYNDDDNYSDDDNHNNNDNGSDDDNDNGNESLLHALHEGDEAQGVWQRQLRWC